MFHNNVWFVYDRLALKIAITFDTRDARTGADQSPHDLAKLFLVPKLHLGTERRLSPAVALPLLTATDRNAAPPSRRLTTRARRNIASAPVMRPSRA